MVLQRRLPPQKKPNNISRRLPLKRQTKRRLPPTRIKKKPKLNISFSGGRTSAYMLWLLWNEHKGTHDIVVTFANTGCEHPDTLRFVHAVEINWHIPVVWLEAVINTYRGSGVVHKIVNFLTASRNGEPFESYIAKYGIPNSTCPSCTARLKTDPMHSYLKSKGFTRGKKINYDTAIGIRADELDRISIHREKNRFIYPLAERGITKQDVIAFMAQFSWDLQIPEQLGNCTWCWKKSIRKHMTLAKEYPEVFNFPKRMEEEFGTFKADCAAGKDGRRYFFRKYLTTDDIKKLAEKTDFKMFVDPNYDFTKDFDPSIDLGYGCSESCEVYPTDGT